MFIAFIITFYRIATTIIVITPIALNLLLQGSIVSSLIYVPLLSLLLAVIFTMLDGKLLNTLSTYANVVNKQQSTRFIPENARVKISTMLFKSKLNCCD